MAALGLMTVAGCARYVNIPPRTGDVAMHSPNYSNVREPIVAAAVGLLKERPITQPFYIRLPEGTTDETYNLIVPLISDYATAIPKPEEGEDPAAIIEHLPILTVHGIRIRGMEAEIDIIMPTDYADPSGRQSLAVVDLEKGVIDGWRVKHVHFFRAPAELGVLYAPPAPSTAIEP
jgi:hypothetical protein